MYLSIPEAAKRLKISRSQCFRLAQGGSLPCVKIGRNMVVDEGAVALFSTIKRTCGRKKNATEPNKIKGEKKS